MIALAMIMGQVPLNRIIQSPFPQQDHLTKGILLDGVQQPLTVRVQLRAPRWSEDRFHPAGLEQRIERCGEFRLAAVEQEALPQEELLQGSGQPHPSYGAAERAPGGGDAGCCARSAYRADARDSPEPPGCDDSPRADCLRPSGSRVARPPPRHAVCHTVVATYARQTARRSGAWTSA